MHRFLGGQGRKIVLAEVSPDRTRAVLRSNLDEECVLRVWDVANQVFVGALVAQGQPVYSIAISHDNKRVVTGSEDCLIRVWDLGSLRALPRAAPAADHANAHRRRAAPFPDHSLLPSVGLLSAHADHRSVVGRARGGRRSSRTRPGRRSTRWCSTRAAPPGG
jgi:WD40 repeat protein